MYVSFVIQSFVIIGGGKVVALALVDLAMPSQIGYDGEVASAAFDVTREC